MLNPIYTRQFERDVKLMIKRGKDTAKIKQVLRDLIYQQHFAPRYRDHKLTGNFKDRRECHIEADWLLVYRATESDVYFERTGTHSDLFE